MNSVFIDINLRLVYCVEFSIKYTYLIGKQIVHCASTTRNGSTVKSSHVNVGAQWNTRWLYVTTHLSPKLYKYTRCVLAASCTTPRILYTTYSCFTQTQMGGDIFVISWQKNRFYLKMSKEFDPT